MDIISFIENVDQNTLIMTCFGAFTVAISLITLGTVKTLNKSQKEQINMLPDNVNKLKDDIVSIDDKHRCLDSTTEKINEVENDNSDSENDSDNDSNNSDDSKDDSDDEEIEYNYKLPTEMEKILNFISKADSEEIETILETCAQNKNIIIPNWYTWHDLMELTGESISVNKWQKLHTKSEDLIDQSNALMLQWYEQYDDTESDSDYEDDNNEEDEETNNNDTNNDSSEESKSKNVFKKVIMDQMLEVEMTKHNDSNTNSDSDSENSENINKKIDNRLDKLKLATDLLKLKYNQLKELADVKNNGYSKSQIIKQILDSKNIDQIKSNMNKYLSNEES